MSIEHAAPYVAAAYGLILAAVLILYALAARRLGGIRRQIAALRATVEQRAAAEPRDGPEPDAAVVASPSGATAAPSLTGPATGPRASAPAGAAAGNASTGPAGAALGAAPAASPPAGPTR